MSQQQQQAFWGKILSVADSLIQEDGIFKEIDKAKLAETFSSLTKRLVLEELTVIDDVELKRRVRGVMLTEIMAGMLNDLTPAQMEAFDSATTRERSK